MKEPAVPALPDASSSGATGSSAASQQASAKVCVCGPLLIEIGGRRLDPLLSGRKPPQLFAYLAVNRHRAVRREELIDALWPVDPPARPEGAFATLLTRTRAVVGHDHIVGGSHLRLQLGADAWIDWEVVQCAPESAGAAFAAGRPAEAVALAEAALELIELGFLPNVEAAWIDERRRQLDDLKVPLADVLARAALQRGGRHVQTAERAARAIIEREPYREDGYALLMEALAAGGNHAEALRTYDRLRTLLREQLGLTPAPAVTALAERVLRPPTDPDVAPVARAPGPSDARVPLPAALAGFAARPLAGREAERRWILDVAAAVGEGSRRVALICGEPGIGKTRLAAHIAALLHDRGWTVLYGRADRESPLTYQPMLTALREYLASRPTLDPELGELLGSELAELTRRLPTLRVLASEQSEIMSGDLDVKRFRLFDAVGALCASAAAYRPALLVLDDLHWADRSALALLRHIVHSTAGCRLLILGTFRDVAVDAGEPLRDLLDELWHDGLFDQLALGGLALDETAQLVRHQLGEAGAHLVGRVHARTNGNPFYVEQTLRGLAEREDSGISTDRDLPLPTHVKQMIEWRIERLAAPGPAFLKAAAVLGPDFELRRAAALAPCSDPDALEVLEDARRAGLVVADAERVDRYAFRHALVQEALHEATMPSQRARLHLAAGELLEREDGEAADPAEVAVHFSYARDVGGAERAVRWRLAAAAQAKARHAHEESVEHHRHALKALEALPSDDHLRARILLGEGQSLIRAGEFEDAQATMREAAELARRLGAADMLADALMDAGAFYLLDGVTDPRLVELHEEALRALAAGGADADLARRARVTARLAVALYWDRHARARSEELAEAAVMLARASGDKGALAFAVGGRHCAHWVSDRPAILLAEAEETIALAHESGDEEFELIARTWRVNHLLCLARIDAVDEEIDRFVTLARRLRSSRCGWYAPLHLAIRSLMEARFEEAEHQITTAATLGARVPGSPSPLAAGAQIFALRWLQGRLPELAPMIAGFVERYPAVPAWRCAQAALESESGRNEHARRILDEFAADGFRAIPSDTLWLVAMALLADACATSGTREHAAALERILAPLAGTFVVSPIAAWLGPVDRLLGLLAAAQGRRDEADALLVRATELCEQARSASLLTLVRADRAEVLLERGRDGDAETARALARAVLTSAESAGMQSAAQRALAILGRMNDD